jgi:hypothetical protein
LNARRACGSIAPGRRVACARGAREIAMRVLRWIGIALAALVLALAALAAGARFADGPVAALPGGPLASGEWVEDPNVDWSFASGIQEIELESAGRSRTTWILVLDGEAYVPCSLDFPPLKRWHEEALERPEAVVRVLGRRYRRRLVRVDDQALRGRLSEEVRRKYGGGPVSDPSRAWFFHLAPG